MVTIKSRPRRRIGAVIAGFLAATAVAGAASAQPAQLPALPPASLPPASPPAPIPPLMAPANMPNFEGTWKLATPTKTLKPASGQVPFTAEGRKQYEENKRLKAKGALDDYDITLSRCNNPGVPRLMLTPSRFKIWQRFGVLTFDFEWNRALRQINAGTMQPKDDPIGRRLAPSMTGTSVGHWEGDTLVAQTTNLSDRTLLDDLLPHTVDIKVTERFRLIDADTLEERITIDDPAYFTQPWETVLIFKRQQPVLFREDICLDRREAGQPAFPQ
ncbi:hypothetical protein WSK_3533 [Novosphingobium sp. Rr 2-17]|uniref:hypothetical protein n=1 Tax=Novosphingobium sp. Rr 2-17 TaxID=555793 RepID=UPI000269A23A|nr:hypothetical protein [Novosphingobium sp. Rr 2-17]EIZ77862.1 hypothetical protein WSK_3533 [Novosphingobium sp. Rr 2-17]